MRGHAFLYPWDVVGDPDAAARLAALGVRRVTLAAAYHSTRALTPRHPRHRIVTARRAAVLYPPDEARWRGRRLRPLPQGWVTTQHPDGAFGEAAAALADAGIEVHSWVVLAHNSRAGEEYPDTRVVNAYGDRYPWAPCLAQPEVHTHLVELAAEAAARPGAVGTELESCGWYGLAHLHAHDKIGGVPLDGAAEYLMSVCFCATCRAGYAERGVDADAVRSRIVEGLEPRWRGGELPSAPAPEEQRAAEWEEVVRLLGAEYAAAVAGWRAAAAEALRSAAVRAVRAAAPTGFRVLLHADPAGHRTGANAGVAPEAAFRSADGVVVPSTGTHAQRAAALRPFAAAAAAHGPTAAEGGARPVVAANLTVVAGLGGAPERLEADARHAEELGADELRLYHAGLASDGELARVREMLR